MRDGTGACGFGLRGSEAREAGPAQEGSRQRWCGRSPEARPLRTTAELWQAHLKAQAQAWAGVRGRSGQKSPRGTPGDRPL